MGFTEYGSDVLNMYLTECEKEAMLKQIVQFTLKYMLNPHMYEMSESN
jgi:hypothetical protein